MRRIWAVVAALFLALFTTGIALAAPPNPPPSPPVHLTPGSHSNLAHATHNHVNQGKKPGSPPPPAPSPGQGTSPAPSVRSSASGHSVGSGCYTISAPTGQQSSDTIVAIMYGYTQPTSDTGPTGFTFISDDNTFRSGSVNGHVWVGSPASSYQFCHGSDSETVVLDITGVDANFPIDVKPVWSGGGTSQDEPAPSILPTLDNTLLIAAAGTDTTGSPLTYNADQNMLQVGSATSGSNFYMAVDGQALSGGYLTATGTRTLHANAAPFDNYGTLMLAISPVVGYDTSPNWSGYVNETSTGQFTEADATWVEPTVTCPQSNSQEIIWVGFDGWTNGTVEQSGTGVQCTGGVPAHYMWWEMFPTNNIQVVSGKTVNPGDTVTATTLYNTSTHVFTLKVNDVTSGSSFSQTTQCAVGLTCNVNNAEYIGERVGVGSNSYADFAKWTNPIELTSAHAAVNGGAVEPITWWFNDRIEMVNGSNAVLAIPSPIESQGGSSSGDSFADVWKRES